MSTTTGSSSRPHRSSSTSRSSRRATLSVGPNGVGSGSLGNGSLSPQRAMRTRVLRERSNDPSSDVGAAGKPKEPSSKGATRAQQMQFAFGSKIIKPSSGKAGMSAAGAGMPTRGRTTGVAAVAADAGNAVARSRRERAVRHEPQEQQQRASSRGREVIRAEQQQQQQQQQQQPTAATREQADTTALKVKLEEKEAVIADLRKKLAKEPGLDARGVPTARSASDTLKVNGEHASSQQRHRAMDELDEGEQATLRAVEEEARAEAEEKLVRAETVAGAGLAHLSKLQGRVDEMLRGLKARRK